MTPNDKLPEENKPLPADILKEIRRESFFSFPDKDQGPFRIGYQDGATAWAGWKVRFDELQAENEKLNKRCHELMAQPGAAHVHKDTVEENWESFWKPIVTNEDGTINIEQIKKELHDFSFIMEQVPKVYCHITGNRMSKVMYHADTVISVADDYFQEQLDEAVKDEKGEQPGAVWVRGDYDRLYDQVKSGKRTVCYVDYAARGVDRVYRDICSIHPDGMEFVARGIGYGSVKYLEGDEKANFIGLCKIKNVEWLYESRTAAGREEDAVALLSWLNVKGWKQQGDGAWCNLISQQYNYTPQKVVELFKQKEK